MTKASGRYVAYYRVSTGRQELSGLGREAQRDAVRNYVDANLGRLIAEYSETVSGRKRNRPALAEALRVCRVFRAILVIARLDRLSRNVEMISALMESGLEFVVTDFPEANRFTIHILAAVAEYESDVNSERMKAVFAAAKKRGTKLGVYRGDAIRRFHPSCRQASIRARTGRTNARARDLAPIIWKLKADGMSYLEIVEELNSRGIPTAKRLGWYVTAVKRIIRATAAEFGSSPEAKAGSLGSRRLKVMQHDRDLGPLLAQFRTQGMTVAAMASELHRRGVKAPRAKRWGETTLRRYLKRATNVSPLPADRQATG
jgi:DNA invertase Pin-like site-specific DNA recombinase